MQLWFTWEDRNFLWVLSWRRDGLALGLWTFPCETSVHLLMIASHLACAGVVLDTSKAFCVCPLWMLGRRCRPKQRPTS